jgi:hypothetical protein
MAKDFTSILKTQDITLNTIPHTDLLQRIGAGLATLQARLDTLDAQLADLREAGVWLDASGAAVVPGWSERKEDGRHIGWVLVWPSNYAEEAGVSRRKYVSKSDLEATRARTERTKRYATVLEERRRLAGDLRAVGNDLNNILRWRKW